MKRIELQGGHIHITKENSTVYQVAEGKVLVYLIPFQKEKAGRRFFLLEAAPGEKIPSFCYEKEGQGFWRIGLVALDKAVLKVFPKELNQELKENFAKRAGVYLPEAGGFEEQLIEAYHIHLVKEEGYIYATAREQETTYKKNLQIIYDLFYKKKIKRKTPESGNRIYDGAAFLCDQIKIPIASYEKMVESCGRRFTLEDIARISHFIIREIVLEEKWYTKDSGPILAYTSEEKQLIICIPSKSGKYIAYNEQGHKIGKITRKYAQTLQPKGYMFYPPFPYQEMKGKDLFFFGIKRIKKEDFLRFLLLAFLGTLIGLLLPYMNEQLYDKFIPMGNSLGLIQICGVILACTIGNLTFTIVKNLASFRSMNTMEYAVQSAAYDRLFQLPENFLRKYDSADLAQRVMGISTIFNILADILVNSLFSAVFSLLYLWRMFRYSKRLSKTALILLLLCMGIIIFIGIIQTKYEKEKMELDSEAGSKMYQFINGISKIRIAGVENRALYEYLKPYTKSRYINIRKEKMTVGVNTFVGAMETVFLMVLYYLMIKNKNKLSIGAFMGFSSAFGSFSGAMLQMVASLLQVNCIKPAYDRCKIVLQTLPEYDENTIMPGNLTGEIEVNNVTFSYDESSGVVLDKFSIHIKAGEYVGIVGSSGSGKSTLLKLLLGFEKPNVGKIYYDGKDIDSLDKRELRKKFGVVLQDDQLIAGSIYENITITSPNIKLAQVKQVIRDVGLEEDIEQMPMGLHTVLSENSATISGGQKQRILIARAIVKRPKIIYFDEATSALDNLTQALVCESLEKLKATRVVIAHRLSTVMNCDRILVLEKGKLIEQGTYQELMKLKGKFYELAIRQIS